MQYKKFYRITHKEQGDFLEGAFIPDIGGCSCFAKQVSRSLSITLGDPIAFLAPELNNKGCGNGAFSYTSAATGLSLSKVLVTIVVGERGVPNEAAGCKATFNFLCQR